MLGNVTSDCLLLFKGLVTHYGEGGGYKMGQRACEVLPLRKGGGGRKKV